MTTEMYCYLDVRDTAQYSAVCINLILGYNADVTKITNNKLLSFLKTMTI